MTSNNGVRGCLSELFNAGVEPQPVTVNTFVQESGPTLEEEARTQITAQDVPIDDVCSELNLILSSKGGSSEQSCLLFGLSPPVRATNPLCRDSRFQKQQKKNVQKDVDIYGAFLQV